MDDVEDGSFTIEVTVPTVVPQSYKVEAVGDDDEEMWDDTVYTVADKAAVQQNKTLDRDPCSAEERRLRGA